MAQVVLTSSLGNRFTGGITHLEVQARNVRQLIRELEGRYPGLGAEIEQASILAIDGEIYHEPFLQQLEPGSEVFVLPKIDAG